MPGQERDVREIHRCYQDDKRYLAFAECEDESNVSSGCAGVAVEVEGDDYDISVFDAGVLVDEVAPVEFNGSATVADGGLGEEFVVVS